MGSFQLRRPVLTLFSMGHWLRALSEGDWPTPNRTQGQRIFIRINDPTCPTGYSTVMPLTHPTRTISRRESGLPIAPQAVAKPLFVLAMAGIMVKQSLWISSTIVYPTHPAL